MNTLINKIPFSIKNNIIINAIILLRNKLGWNKIHKYIKLKYLFTKKTVYSQKLNIKYEIVKNVNCFYSEYEKIFIWAIKKNDLYIYGNPFKGYDF